MNAEFRDVEMIKLSNFKLTQRTLIQKSSHHSNSITMTSQQSPSEVGMTRSVFLRLELKGYTKVSDGIDLITSTERKALQTKVEDLIDRKGRKDPSLNPRTTKTTLWKLRKRMQALKIQEELVVLNFDKKDNADGDKMIQFYQQEEALGSQEYLQGDEFESDASLQFKRIALLDQTVKIEDLRTRKAKFKKETASKEVKSKSKVANAKKQKVDSSAPVNKATWTAKDESRLRKLLYDRNGTYQKYLIELRVIKVKLCRKGLKLESPEARQLFKSFEEAAQSLTAKQRQDAIWNAKRKEQRICHSIEMTNIVNAANEDANARTIVPSPVDPAELEGISRGCLWAEEQLNDIDENDEDFLEMIERIAEHAVSMF